MLSVISKWYQDYFSEPEAVIVEVLFLIAIVMTIFWGDIMAPLLASVVIAYILDWLVMQLEILKVPRTPAVFLVFSMFLGCMALVILILVPVLWQQSLALLNDMPRYISQWQETLLALPKDYPGIVTTTQVNELIDGMRRLVSTIGQYALTTTLSSLPGVTSLIVYLVLVPMLVFFLMFDRDAIIDWMSSFFPRNRPLLSKLWFDINQRLGHYIRGKLAEALIVAVVTYVAFLFLDLNYAMLLAAGVGVSVFIPFIGATLLTIPVAMVAYVQFGFSSEFATIIITYMVIQALDGNVLVPILFSGMVNLHPVAIIIAILIFGGIWGMWGIFFAIPLAIIIQAILLDWPRPGKKR